MEPLPLERPLHAKCRRTSGRHVEPDLDLGAFHLQEQSQCFGTDAIGVTSFLPPSSFLGLNDFQFGKYVRIANKVSPTVPSASWPLGSRKHISPLELNSAFPSMQAV